MNVLFINNIPFNPSLGGIERVTDILTKSLIKKGYNIFYLCGLVESREMLNYDFPVPMHTLPEKGLFLSTQNKEFFYNYITKNKIDILINQRGLEPLFSPALEYNFIKKISVLHSKPSASLKQKIFFPANNYKSIVKNIIIFSLYPIIYLYKRYKASKKLSNHFNYISNKSDAIVLLSELYKNEFLYYYNTKRINIPIYGIPNPNTYPTQKNKLNNKENIILYVGRLEETDKNPMVLLKIWEKLHEKHLDWKLIYVGEGSQKTKLQTYTIKKRIKNVYFEGRKKDPTNYYKQASFICLTSNFEGWPMVLTEGMTFGCIPFAFNSFQAVKDIIDDNINGCIINAFDSKEYISRLEKLIIDKDERKRMSKASQIKAQQFEVSQIIDKWETLFNILHH